MPKNRKRIITWNWLRLVGQFLRRTRVIAGDKGVQGEGQNITVLWEGEDCVANSGHAPLSILPLW